MSTKVKGSNGTEQSSNGSTEETTENLTTSSEKSSVEASAVKDAAAVLEKNRELLAKNKKIAEERDALAKQVREAEEARLKSNEDYKKLAELKEQEAKEKGEKLSRLEKSLTDGKKLRKFLDSVPGKIEQQYWGLIDLDKIVAHPETGEPDEDSVKNIAREFEKTYSAVIKRSSAGTLPNEAAKGAKDLGFKAEMAAVKDQKGFDAVMKKYGKS